jgi:hypothetical protein
MPYPKGYVIEQLGNRLIYEERNYDPVQQLQEFNDLYRNLTGNIKVYCDYVEIKLINVVN